MYQRTSSTQFLLVPQATVDFHSFSDDEDHYHDDTDDVDDDDDDRRVW